MNKIKFIFVINICLLLVSCTTSKIQTKLPNYELNTLNLIQNRSIELSLLLSVPATFGLLIASKEIVNSLFGYGSFDSVDVLYTSLALTFFAIGVPAFALIKVLSNFYFARDNTRLPFIISLVSMFLNILISVSLFKKYGFIIIPIATSVSTWVAVIIYFVLLISLFLCLCIDLNTIL